MKMCATLLKFNDIDLIWHYSRSLGFKLSLNHSPFISIKILYMLDFYLFIGNLILRVKESIII